MKLFNNKKSDDGEKTAEKPKKSLKKRITSFFREFLRIAFVLAVCGGLGIFLALGKRASSPYRYAEEYFSYYVTNNY